ncbi:MAG TPA: IPT/TIG domain-containing protein, partial [Bryobacteraceae bacterium]|nr:IPT/TIG domain-containing protein [Bryobacteraceae bacterium]
VSQGVGALDTFYGSFSANGGNIVGHERLFTPLYNSGAEGYTYGATYPTAIANGTYTNAAGTTQYVFGNNGAIRIGFGLAPYLSMSVALQAPALSGSGVFLNPAGVVNAASFAPFTAGVSGGEFIVLYGTNLAPGTKVATSLPFPTTLNGVQVTVNGLKAPLYYVSPGQIAAIVPYGITFSIAQIQVTNNGTASNSITEFTYQTTPGIFTLAANGLGYGAIEHATDGSVVTASHPAQPGETVSVFVSGLGSVFPPNPEGTAGPANPLSMTTNTINAYVNGYPATVGYAGLAPYLAGLYQVNVTIPSGVTAGDNAIELIGPDSDAYQALIPIGSGATNASVRTSGPLKAHRAARTAVEIGKRPQPCFVIDRNCSR